MLFYMAVFSSSDNKFFLILFHLRNLLMMRHQENKRKSRKQIPHMKRKWYVTLGSVYSYPVFRACLLSVLLF